MSEPRHISESLAEARESLAGGRAQAVKPWAGDEQAETEHRAFLKERADRAQADRWEAAIPRRFRTAAVTDFTEPVLRRGMDRWSEAGWPRPNVVVYGPLGTGKSRAACALAREVMRAWGDLRVMFADVAWLVESLKPGGPEGFMAEVLGADLLILDDLGAERTTDWGLGQIDLIVNQRWLEEAPIIATSNLQPDKLAEHVGAHTYSRLSGCGAVALRLTGDDRRRSMATSVPVSRG